MQLALTRPVRQVLATLLLIGGTVVPTLVMGAIAWRIHQPGFVRDVEVTLGREIGARVTLDAVAYPQPGQVVYRGMIIRVDDARSGGLTEVARADSLIVETSGTEVSLIAEGLTLRADSPQLALAQVSELLLRNHGSQITSLGLSSPHCRINPGSGLESVNVDDFVIMVTSDAQKPNVRASFQVREGRTPTRCELALVRDLSRELPTTTLNAKTMSGPALNAIALSPFLDVPSWFGDSAKFQGSLAMVQVGTADWSLDIQGELSDIDLGTLVARRFPDHEFSGLGRVSITSAHWEDRPGQGPGWVAVRGKLEADAGAIGRGFLTALQDQMRFRLVPSVRSQPETSRLDFRGLGVAFELKPDGEIVLTGALGNKATTDAVLIGSNEVTPLAYAPTGVANVRGLIRALYPVRAETMLPVTAESQAFQRYLPLSTPAQAMIEPRLKAQ